MKPEYDEWVHDWLFNNNALESGGYSRCREASEDMVKDFPSLTVVRGHVYCPHPWGKRGHWWCVEADGTIVDPTASQFPVVFRYEAYVEGDDVRLGTCMNCGGEIWGPNPEAVFSTSMCDAECGRAFEVYINSPTPGRI